METVPKDDLIGIARNIECASLMMRDILQDYFDNHDEATPKGKRDILYNFDRFRKFTNICFDIVYHTEQELHAKGIFCYK